jgi:hypothetical protein
MLVMNAMILYLYLMLLQCALCSKTSLLKWVCKTHTPHLISYADVYVSNNFFLRLLGEELMDKEKKKKKIKEADGHPATGLARWLLSFL